MIKIISNPLKKELIARTILYDLPQWFGIMEATEEYIKISKDLMMFASLDENNEANGFVCIGPHNEDTIEIYIMGVLKKYHNQGIGKQLMKEVVDYAKQNGFKLIEVKTLDATHLDKEYVQTRTFYESVGFYKLDTIKGLSNEKGSCLIMVKLVI